MKCPFCDASDTRVINSRLVADGLKVRRRRECSTCNNRFTTHEILEISFPKIIKKNGKLQHFYEHKLKQGILRALEKRPVTDEQIDEMIEIIKLQIRKSADQLSTHQIGEIVLAELKKIDEVAYIRFASVYRKFADVQEFRRELDLLNQ